MVTQPKRSSTHNFNAASSLAKAIFFSFNLKDSKVDFSSSYININLHKLIQLVNG